MDCRDVAKHIDLYWDRELPPDQSARIRVHLGQCPACHEGYGRLDEWLTSPEPIVVPPRLRDRVVAAVLEAVEKGHGGHGTEGVPALHGRDARATPTGETPVPHSRPRPVGGTDSPGPHRPAAVSAGGYYRLFPLMWAGALAACITLLLVSRPLPTQVSKPVVSVPDPVAIPALIAATFQPSPIAAAGAAMAQATALEQVTQTRSDLALPLQTGRRPLQADWVPPEIDRNVQQLPAVISAVSPLGA